MVMSDDHSCKSRIERVALPESSVEAEIFCVDAIADLLLATTSCPLCFLHWWKELKRVNHGKSNSRDAQRRVADLQESYRSGQTLFAEQLVALVAW